MPKSYLCEKERQELQAERVSENMTYLIEAQEAFSAGDRETGRA